MGWTAHCTYHWRFSIPLAPSLLPIARLIPSTNTSQGGERYQSAFYVFEEMASTPSATGTHALVCQAVSELHLGRIPEAQAALEQALERDSGDVEALANLCVLQIVAGKAVEAKEAQGRLEKVKGGHMMLEELAEKGRLFDEAAKRYSAKVAS